MLSAPECCSSQAVIRVLVSRALNLCHRTLPVHFLRRGGSEGRQDGRAPALSAQQARSPDPLRLRKLLIAATLRQKCWAAQPETDENNLWTCAGVKGGPRGLTGYATPARRRALGRRLSRFSLRAGLSPGARGAGAGGGRARMAPKFNIETADEVGLKDRIRQLTSAVLPLVLTWITICFARAAAHTSLWRRL